MRMIGYLVLVSTILLNATSCQEGENLPVDDNFGPAVVSEVTVFGSDGSYTFSATINSPDTGCEQYADWWEVISADGNTLYYRRILAHSHVNEQPFTRSGGPVAIDGDEEVIVRAHMNSTGYGEGEVAMKGTVSSGFIPAVLPDGFGQSLEKNTPQPDACAF